MLSATPPHPARKSWNRLVNRVTRGQAVHLFLLTLPLSDATTLRQILATSPNVATLPIDAQRLPELIDVLSIDRWNPEIEINWRRVHRVCESWWSPAKPIRLETSAQNLVRARQIESIFPNARFIVLLGNPYLQIHEITSHGWKQNVKEAATFWVRQTETQSQNLDKLSNAMLVRYEDLQSDPSSVIEKLNAFLPRLKSPEIESESQSLALEDEEVARLSKRFIRQANLVLKNHQPLLERFGYELLQPSANAAKRSTSRKDDRLELKRNRREKKEQTRAERKKQKRDRISSNRAARAARRAARHERRRLRAESNERDR